MGKAKKTISKIIPKEIRPALPFVLPFVPVLGPALGGIQSALTSKLAFAGKLAPYLSQGLMSAGTQALTDPNAKGSDFLRTAALSVAPAAISEGLGALPTDKGIGAFLKKTAEGSDLSRLDKIQAALGGVDRTGEVAKIVGPKGFTKAATLAATQTGLSQAPIMARLNEQALRDYEAQLREQGIMDSSERRNKIFGYFSNAGYDADEVNAFLDKYGYADGGRVGYKEGGEIQALIDYLKEKEDEDEEFNLGKFSSGLEGIKSGFEMATGQPLMGAKPQPTRFGLAEGGIPNVMAMRKTIAELIASGVIDEEDVEEAVAQIRNQAMMSMRAPGMAEGGIMNLGGKEMDMRGGGFIPIGAKERADDVPARLSKNEFVMTADAVRAAGGGSINKGAKRMYDLMNKLESKV